VSYGGGVFIAVGDSATMLKSNDGVAWTQVNTGARGAFTSVAVGGGDVFFDADEGFVPQNGFSLTLN
jgi:hypothetical protein